MSRESIAIDVDDVLLDTTDALRIFVNTTTRHELTAEDYRVPGQYWGYYEEVWKRAAIADDAFMERFHAKLVEDQSFIQPITGSAEILPVLHGNFDLLALTSRPLDQKLATQKRLHEVYGPVFGDIVHLGHVHSAAETKGEACLRLGAKWLIEDNVGHCLSTTPLGFTTPLLFGEFGWQQEVPEDLIRTRSWAAVEEYFDGKS